MSDYGPLSVQLYDLLHPAPSKEEFRFYERHVKKATGPVLEPMCGSGRFLIPLCRKGYDVRGFDASAAMLDACRRKARQEGLSLKIKKSDVRTARYREKFGVIFIPSGSFGFLTEKRDIDRALDNLYRLLKKDGRLLLDIETTRVKPLALNQWVDGGSHQLDIGTTLKVRSRSRYQPTKKIWMSEFVISEQRASRRIKTERLSLRVRLHEPDHFAARLFMAGFRKVNIVQEYTYEEPAKHNDGVIFECHP